MLQEITLGVVSLNLWNFSNHLWSKKAFLWRFVHLQTNISGKNIC